MTALTESTALTPPTASALTPDALRLIDAYWRAANYLSVGQMYLCDNPLLARPLALADIKRMLLGHWGTTPGQNFIYAHLNRVICRHGLFNCYEAFVHIVDSMFNQHAKWLKVCAQIPWRQPIASLNILLTSHVWQQDHNGFSHQDPGFIDVVANKKADVVRIYLAPDANCLLSITDHCLRSRNYVNLIIAGKAPALQWLDIESAARHCTVGAGSWAWASNDAGGEPDVVMACAGDVPTLETLAAVALLRGYVPDIRIRVVNVVDLMALQPQSEHPHGLTDDAFDAMFTCDKPIVFAFHGYAGLIHRLTYRRHNHDNLHVRGYKEEGTTTTPFDMVVLNNIDRYQLALDAIRRIPRLAHLVEQATRRYDASIARHKAYICEHGEDLPEVRDWRWPA